MPETYVITLPSFWGPGMEVVIVIWVVFLVYAAVRFVTRLVTG